MKKIISNGDVYDIGQTVNGVSTFLWLNDSWFYFSERLSSEYEYNQNHITNCVNENEFEEIEFIGNIFSLANRTK